MCCLVPVNEIVETNQKHGTFCILRSHAPKGKSDISDNEKTANFTFSSFSGKSCVTCYSFALTVVR